MAGGDWVAFSQNGRQANQARRQWTFRGNHFDPQEVTPSAPFPLPDSASVRNTQRVQDHPGYSCRQLSATSGSRFSTHFPAPRRSAPDSLPAGARSSIACAPQQPGVRAGPASCAVKEQPCPSSPENIPSVEAEAAPDCDSGWRCRRWPPSGGAFLASSNPAPHLDSTSLGNKLTNHFPASPKAESPFVPEPARPGLGRLGAFVVCLGFLASWRFNSVRIQRRPSLQWT
jgi:hypothetical protein